MYTKKSKNRLLNEERYQTNVPPSLQQPSSSIVPVQSQQLATASHQGRSPTEPCSVPSPAPSAVDVLTTDRYVATRPHAAAPVLPAKQLT